MDQIPKIKFNIGDIVSHRIYGFRGVVFDIDPVFSNTDEWWNAIPKDARPDKNQPFYHLFANNGSSSYQAYVSEQNLIHDGQNGPVNHPSISKMFSKIFKGRYIISMPLQ